MAQTHFFFQMIICKDLTKRFGEFTAVDGVSLEIPAGQICTLLGPNGAGKSTLMKMLAGLLAPTSGEALVNGMDVRGQSLELKRATGVLPETLGVFDALTVEEHLQMSGPIYGLTAHETRSRADRLLRVLALEHGRHTFLDQCSHGMRKKTALAMALLHNPRILFLDEPFEGIDPVSARAIREALAAAARKGVTLFLTSHILSIVERLAERIVMIRKGRIVYDSATAELPKPVEDLYFDLVESPQTEELEWLGSPRS